MTEWKKWAYDVLQAFNEQHYSQLLTKAHIVRGRTPINLGTKDDPDVRVYYILRHNNIDYALGEAHIEELPILVNESKKKIHYQNVYDIITSFRSARFKPVRTKSFRELVDSLCTFKHTNKEDFTLWKIIVFAALIDRVCVRVASEPGFGKDSVAKVCGDLLRDIFIITNPTVAKLEYGLTNKVVMLNEMANLTGEERRQMEHFLLATGDMSNVYEKHSRSTTATSESYDISKLSLLIAYNNKDCYPENSKYFDEVFQKATRERYFPIKLNGRITDDLGRVPEAKQLSAQYAEDYKEFIRNIMWYKENWVSDYETKQWVLLDKKEIVMSERWLRVFTNLCRFITLYAKTEDEAKALAKRLYNKHIDYTTMLFEGSYSLDALAPRKFPENELEVVEEIINLSK